MGIPSKTLILAAWILTAGGFLIFRGGMERHQMLDLVFYLPWIWVGGAMILGKQGNKAGTIPSHFWPLALLLAYSVVQWAANDWNYQTRASLLVWTPMLTLVFLSWKHFEKEDWKRALDWVSGMAIATGLWGLWHYGGQEYEIWGEPAKYGPLRVGGMIYYPNIFATCCLILAGARWALAMQETEVAKKEGLIIGALAGFVLLTGSRGAVISMLAGTLVAGGTLGWEWAKRWRKGPSWEWLKPRLLSCVTSLVVIGTIAVWAGFRAEAYVETNEKSPYGYASPTKRFSPVEGEFAKGTKWRRDLHTSGLVEWANPQSVILGDGPNSFLVLSERAYGPTSIRNTGFAHSDFVDWIVDYGLVGILLLGACAFLWVRDTGERGLAWVAPMAAATVLRAGTDSDLHTSAGGIVFALSASAILAARRNQGFQEIRPQARKVVMGAGALMVLVGGWYLAQQAQIRQITALYLGDKSTGTVRNAPMSGFLKTSEELRRLDRKYPENTRVAQNMAASIFGSDQLPEFQGPEQEAIKARMALIPALELAQAAYESNPDNISAGALTAILLTRAGENETGTAILEELKERFPGHLGLVWAEAQNEALKGERGKAELLIQTYLGIARGEPHELGERRDKAGLAFLEGKTLEYCP
jgi:hypothetical protein